MSRQSSALRPAQSVSRSRSRASRDTGEAGRRYVLSVSQPEGLIFPEGPAGEEATELLQEFLHPHRHKADATLVAAEGLEEDPSYPDLVDVERAKRATLSWWKRPSAWWFLVLTPMTAIAMSCTFAPRIELFTMLVCNVHKPEYTTRPDTADDGPVFSALQHASRFNPVMTNLPLQPSLDMDFSAMSLPSSFNESAGYPDVIQLCASDPVVEVEVAKLLTVITLSSGILSCLTGAWWGAFSDRFGRTRILGISVLGVLATDAISILVFYYSSKLPGNYWFLVIGPLIDGSLGGLAGGAAAFHAYIADCTEPSNRSRIFSLCLGLLFTGVGLGPTIGGLVIRATGTVISAFYLATALHVLYALTLWFVLPESLTIGEMKASRRLYAEEAKTNRETNGFFSMLKSIFGFLQPLAIFIPGKLDSDGFGSLRGRKRDWNLALIALAYAFTIAILGSVSFKFQYTISQFGLTSETMGYWISLIGVTRALYLCILLPVAIKFIRPVVVPIQLPVAPSEPLQSGRQESGDLNAQPVITDLDTAQSSLHETRDTHSASFDLALARFALIAEIITYIVLGITTNVGIFIFFTMLTSFGAGFSPALQSLALDLYSRRGRSETGRLFGALSVIQALSSQIIGPAAFGFVYMKTASVFPQALFVMSAVCAALSFVFLLFIRFPVHNMGVGDEEDELASAGGPLPAVQIEETLVNVDTEEEETGGERVVKGGGSL